MKEEEEEMEIMGSLKEKGESIKNGTYYTVKKVSHFPVPSRDVTDQTLSGREKLNYSRPGRV